MQPRVSMAAPQKPVVDQLDRHAMRCTTHRGIRCCAIAARPLERLLAFDEWQGWYCTSTCSAASSGLARASRQRWRRPARRHGARCRDEREARRLDHAGSTQPQRIAWTPSRAMSSPVSITTSGAARML